jgi:hypothetical protein
MTKDENKMHATNMNPPKGTSYALSKNFIKTQN